MEAIHGVDISWLHRPTEGQGPTSTAPAQKPTLSVAPAPITPAISVKSQVETKPISIPSPAQQIPSKAKRPGILSRASSEKVPVKSSFLSSISSKFSSSSFQSSVAAAQIASAKAASSPITKSSSGNSPAPAFTRDGLDDSAVEESEAHVPQLSKSGGSFFSSALRRLSSNAPARGPSVSSIASVAAPRQVLNIDRERERCGVEELDQSRLRRVAFRVDVELMGGAKYVTDDGPERKKKVKENYKEKGEGEALKHPELLKKDEPQTSSINQTSFQAENPLLKQKNRSEGEALKHPISVKEGEKYGKARSTSDMSAQTAYMSGKNDSWDDLDLYGGNAASQKATKKKPEAPGPKLLKAISRTNSAQDWDDLDPYSSSGISDKKETKQKQLAQIKLQQQVANKASSGAYDMDDIDPFGGGQKKVRQPVKLVRSDEDDEEPDSLDFFYGLQRETSRTSQISNRLNDRSTSLDAGSCTSEPEGSTTNNVPFSAANNNEQPSSVVTSAAIREFVSNSNPPAVETHTLPTVIGLVEEMPNPPTLADEGSAAPPAPKSEDRPTTDPLRVYRRCCQLREAPVLKRISEQLANIQGSTPETLGMIATLNLSKSRMQLADMVCLADWLAIVPVKKLLLEDANLTDEGLRVILAGLLAARIPDTKRKRTKSSPNQPRDTMRHPTGMIERLSLKNNRKITAEGWKHLCLFLNMSKSIKAIDVSMVPFPPLLSDGASQTKRKDSADPSTLDMAEVLRKSIVARGGNRNLGELLIAECGLTSYQVGRICDAAISARMERLGLASNHLDLQGLQHVGRYIASGVGTGLDLGGNDLHGNMSVVTGALTNEKDNSMWALSLANCNLTSKDLEQLFRALVTLPDTRLLDLSHNKGLFTSSETLSILRQYLPKLPLLKRLQLEDTSLTPAQAIGIAEVLPECRNIAHVNVLANPQMRAVLVEPANVAAHEEAAAVYASFMTAVRLSKTLLCIDIDVPGPKSSEIVKALARQVVAYCLRNIERFTESDAIKVADAAAALPDIDEKGDTKAHVMQHFLDHPQDAVLNAGHPHGAHEDYLLGGTGVVKALSYCLGASQLQPMSTRPGTPRELIESEAGKATAKEMSKTLLESAHKFRGTLQPIMARELAAANTDMDAIRRLQFLDQTLQGMIERFEQEYPDVRQTGRTQTPEFKSEVEAVEDDTAVSNVSVSSANFAAPLHPNSSLPHPDRVEGRFSQRITSYAPTPNQPLQTTSRRGSETSLASHALAAEEARMHRAGQLFRRQVLPPAGMTDYLHGTSASDREPEHLAALRANLELLGGEELRARIMQLGLEGSVKELTEDAQKMRMFEITEPEKFRKFREAQVVAERSGGFIEQVG